MSSLRTYLWIALGAATTAALPAWAAGPADPPQHRVPAPAKPDVNLRIAVQPGVPKEKMPEKAYGYLARKGAGNGQREGADDPGPPQGETGDGQSRAPTR